MMIANANRLKQVGVEVVPLICLVLGIYFTRLPALPLSLDEPLWGTVAQEMIWTRDWIVPRQHNLVYYRCPRSSVAGSACELYARCTAIEAVQIAG